MTGRAHAPAHVYGEADVLPHHAADPAASPLHDTARRAAMRADDAIAYGDFDVGYASIDEAYAALDAFFGLREALDLSSRAQATEAEPGWVSPEILLLCRVILHFVVVLACLPLVAFHPPARALMLARQAELRSTRLRLSLT